MVAERSGEASCAGCGTIVPLSPRLDAPLRILPAGDGRGAASGDQRVALLAAQARSRRRSPYGLGEAPSSLGAQDKPPVDAADALSRLHAAFARFRQTDPSNNAGARQGEAYRQHGGVREALSGEPPPYGWLASRALEVARHRGEIVQARPMIEQASDLAPDPGFRQIAMCQLASIAEHAGDFDAAEAWLGCCDPEPCDIVLDGSVRIRWASLAGSKGDWEGVLRWTGEKLSATPATPTHREQLGLYRVAALERLGRTEPAEREMNALLDVALEGDLARHLDSLPSIREPCELVLAHIHAQRAERARKKRRARLVQAAILAGVGLLLLALSPVLTSYGESALLECTSPSASAVTQPPCNLKHSLLGWQRDQRVISDLTGAQSIVRRQSEGKSSCVVSLSTAGQPVLLSDYSNSDCEESASVAAQINSFVRTRTPNRLALRYTPQASAILGGGIALLVALSTLLLALIRAVNAMLGRSDDP